jgi:4-amino-4-deoxy-L-arabinose transferase-like glycosyltransferase
MIAALGQLVRGRIFLTLVIALSALYFRAVAIQTTTVDQPLRADAGEYYLSAYNLVHFGIYSRSPGQRVEPPQAIRPDSYRPPGLPLIIAAFLSLSDDDGMTVPFMQIVNVVAGAAAAVALFLAASAVFPLPAAVLAGFLVAASPHLVAVSVYLLTEPFAIALVAMLLLLAAKRVPATGGARVAYFLALGASVGALSLFRPIYIAFAPLLCLAFEGRRDRLSALLLGCAGAACVVAPWMIRNALIATDGSGSLIAATMLDGSYRGYLFNNDPATFPYPRFIDPMFEIARQSVGQALGEIWPRIVADPLGMARWYLIEKTGYLLQWNNVDGAGDVFVYPVFSTPFSSHPLFQLVHRLYAWTHDWIVLLATIGAALVWIDPVARWGGFKQMRVLRMASLLMIFVCLAHLPFFTAVRYALPVFPALYLLCLVPLVMVARLLRVYMAGQMHSAAPVS